jgi:hypothetical protein
MRSIVQLNQAGNSLYRSSWVHSTWHWGFHVNLATSRHPERIGQNPYRHSVSHDATNRVKGAVEASSS